MVASWQHYGTYDESAHPDLWDGVVGYWAPCLGPTGLRLHDVSRYNNWGTLTNMDGATDWVIDGGQYALDFDGTNNYVVTQSATGNVAVQDSIEQWTCSIWFEHRNVSSFSVIAATYSPGFTGWHIGVRNNLSIGWGTLNSAASGGLYSQSTKTITASTLTHIVCRYDAGDANAFLAGQIMIDGVLDVTLPIAGTRPSTLTGRLVGIGATASGVELFNGLVYEVVFWNRLLPISECANVYQLGPGGMLQRKPRRRAYSMQAGFRAHYATQRNAQLIGGGLR
jgi:hypothetical protein